MKKYFKYIAAAVFGVLTFAACSPEEFEGANGQIPTLENIQPVITVDQEINQVTFSLPEGLKGCMPLWLFYENKGTDKEKVTYSTVNGMKKIFAKAGDYEVGMKLMNRNGISDGEVLATFHIDNTVMNFDKYITQLCGGTSNSTKEWRIDNDKPGHMGCGEPGTSGLNWWSAGPNDKDGMGVYDCRLTFGSDYSYTFNPGESGMIYVNKDVTVFPEGPQGEDFMAAAKEQTVQYEFDVDGDDLYIVFPEHTFFPYIANDDIWNTPRYKVESITPQEINLVIDNGGIAWHYILTSGAAAVKFSGFKYDNPGVNLWLPADADFHIDQYNSAGGDWHPVTVPEWTANNGTYNFTLVEASDNQWQSQFTIVPNVDIALSSSNEYDYSVIITPSNDVNAATVKLTQDGDDGNFLFEERVDLKAYEDNIIYFVGKPGIDAPRVKMVFDFGGNPENTEITIKNIVLKDHAVDDGTVLPSDEPVEEGDGVEWVEVGSSANLMNSGELTLASTWWADNNWGTIGSPTVDIDGNKATITVTEANGGSQWQGQVHLNTGVAIKEGKTYNFCITLNATQDLSGATVKPHPDGDDGHFFSEGRHDVAAFQDVKIKYTGFVADFSTENLVITLDFPGCEAGTVIEAKDIIIQEEVNLGWDTPGNLWAGANVDLVYWYSAGDWSGQLHPEIDDSKAPREYKIVIPEGIGGSEWQGQTHFVVDVPASAAKTYNFGLTINSSEDCPVTVKLAWEGNDNDHAMFYVNDFQAKAYEDCKFVKLGVAPDTDYDRLALFVDLGRTPAGAEVIIKDFVLVEAE